MGPRLAVGCRTKWLVGHPPLMRAEHAHAVPPAPRSHTPRDGNTDCPRGWLPVVAQWCRWSERCEGVLQAFQVVRDNRVCAVSYATARSAASTLGRGRGRTPGDRVWSVNQAL